MKDFANSNAQNNERKGEIKKAQKEKSKGQGGGERTGGRNRLMVAAPWIVVEKSM